VREVVKQCHNKIFDIAQENADAFVYYDAMKSPLGRIKNKFRYQVLIRIKKQKSKEIIDKIYDACDDCCHPKVSMFVEINPSSLA
jgi:primosomal protein N'